MIKSTFTLYFLFFSLIAISQTADFTFQSTNGLFCNPATIQFTQNCTGNPIGFVWDFGNNTRAFSGDAVANYTSAGTFNVKLIAIYGQSKVEVVKTIVINPTVSVSIGYDRNYICKPGAINFTSATSGKSVTFDWDFGDASTIVNTNANNLVHSYAAFGNYAVSLKATDTTGCMGMDNTTIQVINPPISATVSPTSGCIPANANFSANVTVPVNDFITKYTWDFGDGSPVLSTLINNVNHSYNVVGGYSPTLNIVTNNGCSNSFNYAVVAYGTPPINHIAYPVKDTVCGSETPVFIAKATNANFYFWDFGDGITTGATDTMVQHKYSKLGTKKVTVTPYFNGCPGTTISFNIEIVGVIADYNYSNTCASRKTYSFTNNSQGNLSSVLWTFGDGTPPASTVNTIHIFPDYGQFITSLKITDFVTGCSDIYSQTIYTARPILLNKDTSICRNTDTRFIISNNYTNPSASYTWNVAGLLQGPTNTPSITVKASILGNFNNFVAINYGPQSCPDTIILNHRLLVRGPNLNFNTPSSICFNSLYNFSNTSTPFIASDSVKLWYWNFGNTFLNDTIYQPLAVKYTSPGSYSVKLTAVDIKGCIDSLIKTATVNPLPFLLVVPQIDTLCSGQSDTLRVFSSDSFLWSPTNNISCNNCDSVVANPVTTTNYYITATTPLNCSVKDSILVKVFSPFTVTFPSNNIYLCLNDKVQLDVDPKKKVITWSPVTGLSNSTIYNPNVSPVQNTVYTATLTDSVGCYSSTGTINLNVKSLPTVNAGPDKILPYNSPFSIAPAYSNNVINYFWSPSTLLSCNSCPAPNGTALFSENYKIKVTSDSGCVATDSIIVFVECKYANILMPKAFTPNNDNLNDTYFPITRGIKSILKFAVYNRQGQLIFEAQNTPANSKGFAWDGGFKGQPQATGAYVYVLEALCELGQKIVKSGSFLLLR